MESATARNQGKKFRRRNLALESLEVRRMLAVNPIISEVMADNNSTLKDSFGIYSDWFELSNPDPMQSRDFTGWKIRYKDTLWNIPAFTLGPNQFRVIFASSRNLTDPSGELHTSFNLDKDGANLRLLDPADNVVHSFEPYEAQEDDISYGVGQQLDQTTFVGPLDVTRYFIPTNGNLGNTWIQPGFVDSGWSSGATGLGFAGMVPGFAVTNYKGNSSLANVGAAENLINTPSQQAWKQSETAPVVNYTNTGGGSNFGSERTFPGMTIGQDQNYFAIKADAFVRIPTAGTYTFGVNSDDGFKLTIGSQVMQFDGLRGPANTLQAFTFAAAGDYPLSLIVFENEGGASGELFAASGNKAAFDGTFRLVGDVAGGGLVVNSTAISGGNGIAFANAVKTNIKTAVQAANNATIYTRKVFDAPDAASLTHLTLKMQYDDGFIAYLNGVKVAERNAPASTTWNSTATAAKTSDLAATAWENIDLTSQIGLLMPTGNVLAIQAMNVAANDLDLLIAAELSQTTINNVENHHFRAPTPGAANTPDTWLADVDFSVKHGFFEQPFNVELTTSTPGASIYYTLNGSTPSPTSGTLYSGPIPISTTKVLRAVASVAGGQGGVVETESYIFLKDVVNQPAAPAGMPGTWGSVAADYAMDTRITNDPAYKDQMIASLKSLPTMSLVTDLPNWFDPSTGIYSNPTMDNQDRAVSVEYFDPNGSTDFQQNAAMRMYGGVGREPQFKKHSIRLIFKSPYGPSKLDENIFGSGAINSYDTITLRSNFNDGWNWGGGAAQFIRDQFARETQIALGVPGSHGDFVHLYINGIYWGLYNPVERPDASFAAKYMGGEKENWDAINAGAPINSSNPTSWNQLMGFNYESGSTAAYQRLQGNNPDGTRNAAYPVLLDVNNYIDNLLVNFYLANTDWPGHNFYAARPEDPGSSGFKSFTWDAEWTIGIGSDANTNVLGINSGLGVPYAGIRNNADFRMLFADHVYRQMFNNGAMTSARMLARYDMLAKRIEKAVIAESARWGDVSGGFYTPATWANERNRVVNSILAPRNGIFIQQLRTAGLYPAVDAPTYSVAGVAKYGGTFTAGQSATINAGAGTLYYTLDGSDPRLPGGAVSTTALVYSGAIALSQNVNIRSRLFSGGNWSALADASFYIDLAPSIRISEIMYNPALATQDEINRGYVATADGNNDFEFIEIRNNSAQTLPLNGLRLSNGIDFTFGNISIAPGQHVLVVSNLAAFQIRYPNVSASLIAGEYTGRLNNAGERVQLDAPSGGIIQDFAYNNNWYDTTDGQGFSLTVRDPAQALTEWDRNEGWRSSAAPGGSPGTSDSLALPGTIVFNEILSNSTGAAGDMIEVLNTSATPIDISGWFLSDDPLNLTKHQIGAGTILAPGAFLVLNQTAHFGAAFALDYRGGDVYLSSNASGVAGGFREHVSFSAAPANVSSGRVTKSTGAKDFTLLSSTSFGAANGIARLSPIVVNEIMYHPSDLTPAEVSAGFIDPQQFEFIELYNRTNAPLSLNNFYIGDGVGFTFGWMSDGNGGQKRTLEAGATATWNSTGHTGSHEVFVHLNFVGADRARRANLDDVAQYVVTHAGGTTTVTVNQSQALIVGDEAWISLGDFNFNGPVQVQLTRGATSPGNWTIAGALKLVQGGSETVLSNPAFNSLSMQRGVTTIAPGGYVVLVSNFAAFDFRHGVTANNIPVAGVYSGNLNSNGEWIRIFQTAAPEGSGFVAAYEIDRVNYEDNAPWPVQPDGTGPALVRAHVAAYGNDPINWQASNNPGTPGGSNVIIDNTPPSIPGGFTAIAQVSPARITLNWTASADAQSSVRHYIIYRDGQQIGTSTATSFVDTSATAQQTFAYQVSAVNRDGYESAKTQTISLALPGMLNHNEPDGRHIEMYFNEPLNPATAGQVGNYSVSNGVGIASVALSRNNTLVTLTLLDDLASAATYTVTMSNLTTVSGNQLPAVQQFTFQYQFNNTGTILREYWMGIGGNNVSQLTANSAYPNNPSGRDLLTSFEVPRDWGDNHGQRVRGYILPPQTGNYRFWIASDDDSELHLSTNDNPANKVRIAYMTGAVGFRDYANPAYPSQVSNLIFLTAGQRYYIEGLTKEGIGGDHMSVRWQLPDGTWENNDATLPIPGTRLMPFGQLTSNTPPAAPSNLRATLASPTQINLAWDPTPNAATTVQHYAIYRDGVLLNTTTNTTFIDTNNINPKARHSYQIVPIGFGNVEGTRTPVESIVPLGVAGVSGSDNTLVRIIFTEPVTAATAQNIANYAITGGVTISNAVLEADGYTVTLTTSNLGTIARTLTISNIRTRDNALIATANEQLVNAPPGWAVTGYKANFGTIGTLAQAQSVVDNPANRLFTASESTPLLNYLNSGGTGHYSGDRIFPGSTGGIDNYVIRATAKLRINTSGVHTFGVNSDDGFRLTIGTNSFQFDGGRGVSDTLSSFNLAAGVYDVTLLYFEGGGDAAVEVFGIAGNFSSWNSNFRLLGDVANGGLSLGNFFSLAPFTVDVNPLGTSDSTPELTGTVSQPGVAVTVRLNGVYYAATNNGTGTWTLPRGSIKTPLAAGIYDLSVAATDPNGNIAHDGTFNELVIDSIPPTANVTPVTPNPRSTAVNSINIVFSKPVTGLDINDVHLIRDGGSDLIDGSQALTTSDNITWTLSGLSDLTAAPGSYTLTLAALGSGIIDAGSNLLALNASTNWSVVINTIAGTAADDTVMLVRNGAMTDVFVNGNFSQSFDPLAGGQIQVDLLAGTNTLTIDYSGGNPLPAGGLSYLGAGGINILNAIGTPSSGPNTLKLTTATPLAQLNVTAGRVTLESSQLAVTDLSITGAGRLDLGSSSLLLTNPGSLRQYLLAGYNGGAWNGATGLFSSWAAEASGRMIGYIASGPGLLVKPTLAGDVNLDLTVNHLDFNTLYGNFGSVSAIWEDGDTNYDEKVDFTDFQMQERTFGQTAALSAPVVAPAKPPARTTPVKPVVTPVKKTPAVKVVAKPAPVKVVAKSTALARSAAPAKSATPFATTRIKK